MAGKRKYTDDQYREIVQRYVDGETMKAIASDMGCSTCTVWKIVNKHFRGELVLDDHERNDTMNNEKTTETKETPAAAATATDEVKQNDSSKYSCYLNNNTESGFCQALLTQIIELADDIIADESTDAEVAGYAGKIGGLAMAIREVFTNNGR